MTFVLPGYPDAAFPNTIIVRLCDDAGNVEGGFNPVAGSPATFPASVQDRGSRWEAGRGVNINVSSYYVFFQTNPNLSLSRPIRNGDQIEHDGDILTVVDRIKDRGGYGCLWRLKCELVNT